VFARFSVVAGERGAADAERDIENTARAMGDARRHIKERHVAIVCARIRITAAASPAPSG
jgi:catalase